MNQTKKILIRILCAMICAIMTLSTLCTVSALDAAGLENVAPQGTPYCSSYKNPNWTPVESINDQGTEYAGWQGWEPLYPSSAGGPFSGEYCGIKFGNEETPVFYKISGARLTLRYNAGSQTNGVNENPQDITYTLQGLIDGEWVDVYEFHDHDYENFEDLVHYDQFVLEASFDAINTNNIRIYCSNYGKNYGGGDELLFPYVYELELYGVPGEVPDVVIPEGYALNANAVLSGTVDASSAQAGHWPALIARDAILDGVTYGTWKAAEDDTNAFIRVMLQEATAINTVTLTFGADAEQIPYKVYATYENGVTSKIHEGTVKESSAIINCKTDESPDGIVITELKVVYEGKGAQLESVSLLANERLLYRVADDSDSYKQSCAKGNLAILGTPYAESTFPDFADVKYINDGESDPKAKSWHAYGNIVPTYCGVTLDGEYEVNKVALVFEGQEPLGSNVLAFDIQARVDGVYVTVTSGYSYNKSSKYKPVFEFDPVLTDDIRIVFTSNGGIFPSVREVEVYSETAAPAAYMGYPTIYQVGGPDATTPDARDNNLVYDTTTRNELPDYIPAKDYDSDGALSVTLLAEATTGVGLILFAFNFGKKKSK